MELDAHVGFIGGEAPGVDGLGGGVDCDRARTEPGERDRRARRVAEHDHTLGRHVSAQAQIGLGR